jgi:hypothetical protein
MKQGAGKGEGQIQHMPHGRAGRTAVAEKSHGFLIIIFPGAAVITALPQVPSISFHPK